MFERTNYATHPDMMECVSNEKLRDRYLIEGLFREGECALKYSHADRFVIGGVVVGGGEVRLPDQAEPASKSGVAGLTKLLANEWAAKGVNVNAIAPGYIATNNTAALHADETRNRQILERIPAARWGEPSDLGGAAIFLASDASNYVHGHILAVDGGWLAR